MKYFLFACALMISLSATPQEEAGTHSNRQPKPQISKADSAVFSGKKNDTMRLALKDSTLTAVPASLDSMRILLVKNEEEKESNFYRYWFPLLMVIIGAIAGAALALGAEYVRRWFTIRKAGKRWIGLAKIYIPAIENQEKLIDEFLAKENPDKYVMAALNRVSTIDGEQFSVYSKEDLLSYLETHKKNPADLALKKVTKLTSTLSALKFTYQQLDNGYRLYETAISRHSDEANQLLRNIGAAMAEWTGRIEARGFLDGEEAAYDGAIRLYQEEVLNKWETDAWDLFELEENFYDPMIALLGPGFSIREVYQVLKSIEVAKYAIPQVKAQKHYMVDTAQTLLARYKEYRADLAEAIAEIEGPKSK